MIPGRSPATRVGGDRPGIDLCDTLCMAKKHGTRAEAEVVTGMRNLHPGIEVYRAARADVLRWTRPRVFGGSKSHAFTLRKGDLVFIWRAFPGGVVAVAAVDGNDPGAKMRKTQMPGAVIDDARLTRIPPSWPTAADYGAR